MLTFLIRTIQIILSSSFSDMLTEITQLPKLVIIQVYVLKFMFSKNVSFKLELVGEMAGLSFSICISILTQTEQTFYIHVNKAQVVSLNI